MPASSKGSIVRREHASQPNWEDQRSDQRAADVEIPVEVCARGAWWPATVLNFSAQGIGLVGDVELELGDVISIAFANGVSVFCTVRWCENRRFGVSVNGALKSTLLETFKQSTTDAQADGKKHEGF